MIILLTIGIMIIMLTAIKMLITFTIYKTLLFLTDFHCFSLFLFRFSFFLWISFYEFCADNFPEIFLLWHSLVSIEKSWKSIIIRLNVCCFSRMKSIQMIEKEISMAGNPEKIVSSRKSGFDSTQNQNPDSRNEKRRSSTEKCGNCKIFDENLRTKWIILPRNLYQMMDTLIAI